MNTNPTSTRPANENTTDPVAPGDCDGILPEFGRIEDVQRLYGIRRGTLYNLINAGLVKSVCLRRPGSKTGCRLIHLASVRDLLHAQMKSC